MNQSVKCVLMMSVEGRSVYDLICMMAEACKT